MKFTNFSFVLLIGYDKTNDRFTYLYLLFLLLQIVYVLARDSCKSFLFGSLHNKVALDCLKR